MPAKSSNTSSSKECYYDLLGVCKKNASSSDIRRGYYKMALKCHPDRISEDHPERDHLIAQFKRIGRAYEVLSDANLKAIYDDTGMDPDDPEAINTVHYVNLFSSVTTDDLDSFSKQYRFSEEERQDVLASLISTKGDVVAATQHIFFANVYDEQRFLEIAKQAIDDGLFEPGAKYLKIVDNPAAYERSRKRRIKAAELEAMQADKVAKSLKKTRCDDSLNDQQLVSLIRAKQDDSHHRMDSLIESLEAKYVKKPSAKRRK